MKRILLPILSVLAALALPSCFQHSSTLHLNKDGSATLVEETTLGAQMVAMMEQMAGLGGEGAEAKDPFKDMVSEDKAKERATKLGEGVTVKKVEPINANGSKGVRITYAVADVNKLKLSMSDGMQGAMPQGPGGEAAKKVDEKPTTFKYADGKLTITMPDNAPPKGDEGEAAKPEMPEGVDAEQMEAQMKQVMGDMKMSLKVVVEPGIAETNATHVDGNAVTLMEMDMGKIMENPGAFKKLQSVPQGDEEKAMEVMKELKGAKVETKKEITISVK